MKACSLEVPEVFAVFTNGKLLDSKMNIVTEAILEKEKDYFVKEINGECASFVLFIKDYNDYLAHKKEIIAHNCIFQRRLRQSKEMNAINPYSVNTLRIVTINKDGEPYVLAAELRIGTSKTGSVDNAAAGGVMVGINPDGTLKKWGFMKPGHGKRNTVHPDSGVEYASFSIPNWDEIIKLVCTAHKQFYGIHSIGWDVGLSENGPMFIEGNDNWEISGLQSCNGGLKDVWKKAIK